MDMSLWEKRIVLLSFALSLYFPGIKTGLCAAPPYGRPADTAAPTAEILRYIDPTIGNVAQLLVPTRPTVHLVNGGTLEFEMGPDPNKKWGADDVPGVAGLHQPIKH